MEFTKDVEALIHLISRAFARTHGQVDSAETYAGTVVEHAKAIAGEDASKQVAPDVPAAPAVAATPAEPNGAPQAEAPAQPQ